MMSFPSTFVGLPAERLQALAAAAQLPEVVSEDLVARVGRLGGLVQSRILKLDQHGACKVSKQVWDIARLCGAAGMLRALVG